ncbi:MAG: hypothetical protein AAB966_00150 [Patescibacteria group bacterium]
MDLVQILLAVTLAVISLFIILIGIQIIAILKEIRKTLERVDEIVGNVEKIGNNIENGISEATGFMQGAKGLMRLIEVFGKKKQDPELNA